MKTTDKTENTATPVAAPAPKEITFLKNHQLEGKEVPKGEKRTLAAKTADRFIANGIAK